MQTLRKKTSPLKYKNETTRFLGDGVSFKAKLIGILEVSEARGDRMCQEALSDLKMAIRAAGEHKQRITINIAIDGLRLRDEKTGDSLYHHPVHKISFIAQDMTDSRAFGYIFGSPDTGHRFFGIKTDKAASQVVIAMRDLFQVVFALKKKEIELAKQHLEKTYLPTSPLFSDSSTSSSKLHSLPHISEKSKTETKGGNHTTESKNSGTAVADLVDLELELSSLQQGLNQMERITPSDPFGSKDDPFGDSFISYPVNKPILPPPPSSGRERSSRTSDSSSLFSPKPHTAGSLDANTDSLLSAKDSSKEFTFSHDFNSSHEDPSSADWFTPTAGNSIFEEPPLVVSEPTKDEKHEMTKQEIMSQFDVFTELDPLELKNPPKKALNDLASNNHTQEPPLFTTNFIQTPPKQTQTSLYTNTATVFSTDPFGEDPFVKEDPFADSDFSKQDPFETEFATFPNNIKNFDKSHKDNLQALLQTGLSKSPNSSTLEKQMSLNSSPRTVQFSKQNTFDIHFEKYEGKKFNKLSQLHENPSLDMSSESECAPEPPPRPAATLMHIKPPPLPPKKQNDLAIRPPPRPPHTEESNYEYMESYETAPNSIEFKNIEKSPPLPVPLRKSKFESDFTVPPERPKKQFNLQSSEEDYLTPISFPEKSTSPTALLPPPQKINKRKEEIAQVTIASFLESKPNITTSLATDNFNRSLEGLDITLSQLTLSSLNDLATKLNIPPSQLSNMTLVQLTNYLSNFIKSKSSSQPEPSENNEFPEFQADFAANFNGVNDTTADSFDRYAVFRELQEEIKQTKIDTEPEQIQEEKEKIENTVNSNVNLNLQPIVNQEPNNASDKYAALREIVEIELKQSELQKDEANQNQNDTQENINDKDIKEEIENRIEDINIANKENSFIEEKETDFITKTCIIEYCVEETVTTPIKSPTSKTPVRGGIIKSPVPTAITEIIQNNRRLNSGSLSDVVSGSSPEVDNTASNSEAGKKVIDATELAKDKPGAVQSEEGVSPWSSDSKEFGNGSPTDWRKDSGSGNDQWPGQRREQEGWWDTSAEPESHYYPQNRRSTDSYDEEYYECYDRPRRRRQGNWQHGSSQAAGGHSSSSRDVSPWEEEPRRVREERPGWTRHPRGHSFDRHRERRHTDSWDEEDDYEYDKEHATHCHWSGRHGNREGDRYSTGSKENEDERWADNWTEDRRHRKRREGGRESREPRESRERWCCPDWEHDKPSGRYPTSRRVPHDPRDRHDERYYSRESQESPWEDEYPNKPEPEPSQHYLTTAKRTWKQRPSSASEMDRKTGEIKSKHYLGGSDGERDRRHKAGRRSRSRDSQYSEPSHRHKPETAPTRNPHRNRQYSYPKPIDNDFADVPSNKLLDMPKTELINRKSSKPKKSKDVSKTEETVASTFPRKATSRAKSLFENDFVISDENLVTQRTGKFNFENDFETSEANSPVCNKPFKGLRQMSLLERGHLSLERQRHRTASLKESKVSPRYQAKSKMEDKSKSLFEDDFSPGGKEQKDAQPEDNSISSIKEEADIQEEEDSFGASNFENATNGRKKILVKNRLSGSRVGSDLKKSGSVNIFARESDPFDDDFFSGMAREQDRSPRNTELRWTDDFEEYDIDEK